MMTMSTTSLAPDAIRQSLRDRLVDFRRQVVGRLLLEGCARLLAAALLLALATFILDRAFRLSVPARLTMLVFYLAGLIYLAWRQILVPLQLKFDGLSLISALDASGGIVTARAATILGLPDLLQKDSPPSAAMVCQAVRLSHDAMAKVDFPSHLDDARRNWALAAIAGAVILPAILTLLAPQMMGLWAKRFFLASSQPWPQKTYLQVAELTDGILVVPRGEPFALRVSARRDSQPPQGVTLRYSPPKSSSVSASMSAFGPNDFRYDFSGVDERTSVQVAGGDDVVEFVIRPAERPRISRLELLAQHPTQSQPQSYTFGGEDADLSFLPRTRMTLLFWANTPIAQAHLSSATTRPSQADLTQLDDRRFSLQWTQEAGVHLQIALVAKDANLVSVPTDLSIGLKIDHPPRLTMSYSGVHPRITPQARIPLLVDARDDFAVAHVALEQKIERADLANPGKFIVENSQIDLYGPQPHPTEPQVQPAYTLDVEKLKIPPGSLLSLCAAATDNCYTGPQTSRSRQITFRIVTPEELFREILLRQQAERAKFRKQTDEAHALAHELAALQSPSQAPELAHRFHAMQREVSAVAMTISQTVLEMRLNALATDEAYDLIQKNVQTPLKNLADNLISPQKDALDALNAADSRSVADARDRQEKIAEQMEEILRQMSQWDSFVDVLNQLNEIIRMQTQTQQDTADLKKHRTEGVFEP